MQRDELVHFNDVNDVKIGYFTGIWENQDYGSVSNYSTIKTSQRYKQKKNENKNLDMDIDKAGLRDFQVER